MTTGLVCSCPFDAEVMLQDRHGTRASLAPASQQNNKHASQTNSCCHVVNGLRYTGWRPAEAFDLGREGGEGRGETYCFDGGGGVAVGDGRGTSTNSRRVVEFVSGQTGRSMGGVLPGGSWESGLAHQRALIHFLKAKSWLKPPRGLHTVLHSRAWASPGRGLQTRLLPGG